MSTFQWKVSMGCLLGDKFPLIVYLNKVVECLSEIPQMRHGAVKHKSTNLEQIRLYRLERGTRYTRSRSRRRHSSFRIERRGWSSCTAWKQSADQHPGCTEKHHSPIHQMASCTSVDTAVHLYSAFIIRRLKLVSSFISRIFQIWLRSRAEVLLVL